MVGMNGVIFVRIGTVSLWNAKFWDVYLGQPEEKVMKWLNGCSKATDESSLEDQHGR